MNYKDAEEIDLKLGLSSGSDISVDNIVIKPYTLREIKDFKYTHYMSNLQWILISIDDFIESILDKEGRKEAEENISESRTFDFYTHLGGKEMTDKLLVALKMLLRTDDIKFIEDNVIAVDFVKKGVLIEDDDGKLIVDEEYLNSLSEDEVTLIHRDNFDDIVQVAKLQNYLIQPKKKEEDKANPADDETRKLIEDMERTRQKVESKKNAQKNTEKTDGDSIDISDIVSAVSSKSNSINKLNIWDLTLYQVYDEYSRLEVIDNYNFSIQAMMAGAENVELKHWSSRI